MKKRLIAVFMAATLTATMAAGCGKNNPGADTGADAGTEATETTAGDSAATESTAAQPETSSEPNSEATIDAAQTETPITILTHPVSCESSGKELAVGSYPEIVLSDEYKQKYPNIQPTIDDLNFNWKNGVTSALSEYGFYRLDSGEDIDTPYASEVTVDILRADDTMLTIMASSYDYAGGAHPMHGDRSDSIDVTTGKLLSLKDVLKDDESAPQAIMDELYAAYPQGVEEFESYAFVADGETTVDQYRHMLEDNTYTWSIRTEGLRIYFSPYEVASYAAGYLEALLPFDKYPDLVEPKYIPQADIDNDAIVTTKELEKELIEAAEPDYGQETEMITVPNKSWAAFTEDGRGPDDGEHITLTKTSEKKTDWLDSYVWQEEHGFGTANLPYSDENYQYVGNMPEAYQYMYNGLDIYDASGYQLIYSYDLHTLCNGPDEETGRTSATTQFIKWAKIYDGTLYLNIIQNGYSTEEPNSSYMVAIAPDTGYVLWRSEPLVANCDNFQIVKDTIICGYGFTAEPDYIYLLDRFTGQQMDKIKVNSAPGQFEVIGDTLYVATYNTAYEFKIETK